MSETEHKAVFLSYASQDAEAAKRICDALRQADVEVWFDQNELVGGDAWDQKIRKQIKDCALLIPIISAATQARTEGYFRLEWRLADQRTHLMAKGRPFLLPVVIDNTRDAEAHVPDSFTEVQWTRLPGGNTSEAFAARVKRLLSGEQRAGSREPENVGRDRLIPPAPREPGDDRGGISGFDKVTAGDPALQNKPKRWLRPVLASAAVLIVALGLTLKSKFDQAASAPAAKPAPAAPAEKTTSKPEVAALLARVRASLGRIDTMRAELDTMEGLLGEAAKLDPTDASVWAEWALLDCRYLSEYYDQSPARRDAARQHAAQAGGLDSTRPDVRLAQAFVMSRLANELATQREARKILLPLLDEIPGNGEVPIELGWLEFFSDRPEAALSWLDRAALVPGYAARAHFDKARLLVFTGQPDQAGAEFDRALAADRASKILLWKAYILMTWNGDLVGARHALDEVPPQVFVEDMPAVTRYYLELLSRNYDQALAAIRAVPHNYLQSVAYSGPAGYFNGCVLELAGKTAAAELERRSALATVERRLAAEPNDSQLMMFKALLQTALGERDAGLKTWKAMQELYPSIPVETDQLLQLQLQPESEAFAWVERQVAKGSPIATAAVLRLDPVYDPIRSDLRFPALLARAEADPRLSPTAKAGQTAVDRGPQTTDHGLPAQPDQKSVAVLAFSNLSDDKGNEYFSDGISEELLNVLAKVPKLKVAARTSSFSFKGQNVPVPEIAQKLGVAYVVEGSVRKAGNKVRITAQLIKAADGFHVWSETYDRELQDIFAVQDEIAKNILVAVKGSLLGEAELPHTATTNTEAYALFLRAQGQLATRSQASMLEAERLFVAALAIDPDYVPALVGLARTRFLLPAYVTMVGAKARAIGEQAKRAAQHALELDPRNAGALAAHGSVLSMAEWRWAEGEAELLQARELAPNDAWVANLTGDYFMFTGNVAAALAAKRKWLELDPLSAASHWDLGFACIVARDYDQAIHWGEEALKMAPNSINPYLVIALAAGRAGRFELMTRTLATARREVQDDQGLHLLLEAHCAILEKRTDEAHRLMAQVEPLAEKGEASPAYLGYCHLLLGESDRALAWLQRAYDLRDPVLAWRMNIDFAEIAADPKTRPLLEQPGLKELHEIRQRNARDAAGKQ